MNVEALFPESDQTEAHHSSFANGEPLDAIPTYCFLNYLPELLPLNFNTVLKGADINYYQAAFIFLGLNPFRCFSNEQRFLQNP